MDNITFTRKADSKYVNNGKSVGVRANEWEAIRDIAEKSGMTMTEVATMLVAFALKYVTWDK